MFKEEEMSETDSFEILPAFVDDMLRLCKDSSWVHAEELRLNSCCAAWRWLHLSATAEWSRRVICLVKSCLRCELENEFRKGIRSNTKLSCTSRRSRHHNLRWAVDGYLSYVDAAFLGDHYAGALLLATRCHETSWESSNAWTSFDSVREVAVLIRGWCIAAAIAIWAIHAIAIVIVVDD